MPETFSYEYRTRAGNSLVKTLKRQAVAAGRPDPFRDLPKNLHRGMAWERLEVSDQETGDGQIADMALAALDRVQGKPFFFATRFLRPHLPFVAPQRYWEFYAQQQFAAKSCVGQPIGRLSSEIKKRNK